MNLNWRRIKGLAFKEFQDFKRNRFIVLTMTILPIAFVIAPLISIFTVKATVLPHQVQIRIGITMLYMLLIPAIVPTALAAYSVIGERDQGTLEPILITPISREEFLIGKALAAIVPAVAVAYFVFGAFLLLAFIFANHPIENVIFSGPRLLIQFVYTPLIAGWSVWAGIGISSRTRDVRVAQQLSTFASLPPLILVVLFATNAITPTVKYSIYFAIILIVINLAGWKFVSKLFNREDLITGKAHS